MKLFYYQFGYPMQDWCAIFINSVSLFDISVATQLVSCLNYCTNQDLKVVSEVRSQGYITMDHAYNETWAHMMELAVTHVVFYQIRQINAPIAEFYAALRPVTNLTFHFVKDRMIFNGQWGSTLRIFSMTHETDITVALRSFITIMHMKTISTSDIKDYVIRHFGTFDILIHVLKLHTLLVLEELVKFKHLYRNSHRLQNRRRYGRRNRVKIMSLFMRRLKALRCKTTRVEIDDICTALACVSL